MKYKTIHFSGLGLVAVVVLFFLVSAQIRSGAANPAETAPAPATPAPAWTLQDVNGKPVHSADFAGKVVVLDFWATWCPPCRMEIPGFIELHKEYAGKGLVVVGVSLDQDGADGVKRFMDKQGMTYPVVMADQKIVEDFGGVEAIPTTFIIDRQGRIVRKHVGYTEGAEFEAEIKPLLNQPPPKA